MSVSAPPRPAATAAPRRRPRTAADLARGIARVTGELMLTLGAVVLLFVGWQLWGTGIATSHAQATLRDQLAQQWSRAASGPRAAPGPTSPGAARPGPQQQQQQQQQPDPGTSTPAGAPPAAPGSVVPPGPPVAAPPPAGPVSRLLIPAIGVDWVVVQGVELTDLADGPGHYPDSAMPGQIGNFAVAGHRTTHGAPFFRIAELREGDVVEVEVADRIYTYRVTSHQIVAPQAVSVVAPVPGRPGVRPTRRLLTLTSCNPRYSASQRYVVHAELATTRAR